jgi:hypothetical protein
VIWLRSEQEYFCREDWTTQIILNLKENFFSASSPHERSETCQIDAFGPKADKADCPEENKWFKRPRRHFYVRGATLTQ